jgi:hypothetical protein
LARALAAGRVKKRDGIGTAPSKSVKLFHALGRGEVFGYGKEKTWRPTFRPAWHVMSTFSRT